MPTPLCYHCGLEIPPNVSIVSDNRAFCCSGCATVYRLLTNANLGRYYEIKQTGASWAKSAPVSSNAIDFSSLDDPAAGTQYEISQTPRQMRFFLEGIHCVACVWILEQLQILNPDIISSRFNLGKSVILVHLKAEGQWSKVAHLLTELGYTAHPLAVGDDGGKHRTTMLRRLTVRIGIAGAITGNIMLLAICRYAGLGGTWAHGFDAIMAILALPVATYVAVPFYTSAWGALRQKRINIDVPVTLAILVGYSVSLLNVLRGSSAIYFDSVSMFTFLLLSTRTFFISTHARFDDTRMIHRQLLPRTATVVNTEGKSKLVASDQLEIGQRVSVASGALIPTDGLLTDSDGWIDTQLLSGESTPEIVKAGSAVFAGTRNMGEQICIQVTQPVSKSRISGLILQLDHLEKPQTVQWADRVASRLIGVILMASTVLFAFTTVTSGWNAAINQYLAFVLISCPCALAIATPLTYAFAQQRALNQGILTLKSDLFDRLKSVDQLYFDKTGTLTTGQLSVTSIQCSIPGSEDRIYTLLGSLEAEGTHPIAVAIRRHLSQLGFTGPLRPVENWHVKYGQGIGGLIDSNSYFLNSIETTSTVGITHQLELRDEQALLAIISLIDQISSDTRHEIQTLRHRYECQILSGDHPVVVNQVARELGIRAAHSHLTPEDKQTCSLNILER